MKNKLLALKDNPFFWNIIASTLAAFQTALLLAVVTRVIGLEDAGYFTVAMSIAMMLQTVALFDMRSFQVTDVKRVNSFQTYFTSRVITCTVMLIGAFVYVSAMHYTGLKRDVILAICFFRDIDAMEDVLHGHIQSEGRLEVAAKMQVLRYSLVMITFVASALISRNLLLTIWISSGVSLAVMLANLPIVSRFTRIRLDLRFRPLLGLMLACLPLFVGSYLSMYLDSAPKLAIDRYLSSEDVARYGIVAMLSFVVNLFSGFAFRPLLKPLADRWNNRDVSGYLKIMGRLFAWIGILFVLCEAGCFLLGIPVLELFYGIELSDLKPVLMTVILGGSVNAVGTILYHAMTCIRKQKWLLLGYGMAALCAMIAAPMLVQHFGLMGAALTLTVDALINVITISSLFLYFIHRAKQ